MIKLKKRFYLSLIVAVILLITSNFYYSAQGDKMSITRQDLIEQRLEFTCVHEVDTVPPVTPEADKLFKKARALEKVPGTKYSEVEVLYRQAAELNHWKAMNNLQNLIAQGKIQPLGDLYNDEEAINIVEKMISQNIAAGYLAMGHYLSIGFGVNEDKNAGLVYMRKAADLGSPQAQFRLGEMFATKLTPNHKNNELYRPELGLKMLKCAAEQGEVKATYLLAVKFDIESEYEEAVRYYHLAAKQGHEIAAFKLSMSFVTQDPTDRSDFLNLPFDQERSRRYKLIVKERSRYYYAKFPDIDQIVPLPPAPLPKWDGTFQYRKEIELNLNLE